MNDDKAYIDLVFRNGLKDYEESPPPEVWTNIMAAIDRKKKYLFFLRSAASIAVIVSIGILAYMLGNKPSKENFSANVVATNNEPVVPVDIFIPPSIIKDEIETAVVADIIQEKIEPVVIAPVAANSETIDAAYAENFNVDVLQEPVAELESFPETQETLTINYDNIFSSGYNANLYNDSYKNIEDNESKWSIMAMASPTYSSQFTTSRNDVAYAVKAYDNEKSSYSGGVGVAYKVNKRLSVQSGVYYSSRGQELGDITTFIGFHQHNPTNKTDNFEIITSRGTVYANPDVYLGSSLAPERVITDAKYANDVFDPFDNSGLEYTGNTLVQDIGYLELPLLLRFKAIDKKVGVSFIGGMSSNFLVNSSSVYNIVDGEKKSIATLEGLNKHLFGSSLGMGMEYKFSQNLSFNVEPTLKYLFNFDKITGLHTYSFGLFSGVSYKF